VTLLIIYCGVILLATGWPIPEHLGAHGFHYDKFIHFGLFFFLSLFALRVLKIRDAFILIISIALWSEIQQFFVPVRNFELADLLVNLFGGSIPLLLKIL